MTTTEIAQYEEWVRRANDPRESEAARAECRVRMADYVGKQLRGAFQLATRQATRADPDRT